MGQARGRMPAVLVSCTLIRSHDWLAYDVCYVCLCGCNVCIILILTKSSILQPSTP